MFSLNGEPITSLTSRESERLFGVIERLRSRRIPIIYIRHIVFGAALVQTTENGRW